MKDSITDTAHIKAYGIAYLCIREVKSFDNVKLRNRKQNMEKQLS